MEGNKNESDFITKTIENETERKAKMKTETEMESEKIGSGVERGGVEWSGVEEMEGETHQKQKSGWGLGWGLR